MRGASAAALVALALLASARATAHPEPATPPEFAPGACIEVIDTRETQTLDLAYDVAFDDDVFALGEIQLPDAKTHQFFAFAGVVGEHEASGGYQLFPFDASIDQPLALPLWLEQSDVDRAAAAAGPADMTGFTASQVAAGDVLAARSDLDGQLHALSAKRVPITQEQAQHGVRWDLGALAPGLYTVGGYVFSPPYNAWAPRFGVVKLVAGPSSVPAAAIEPIDSVLFAGRGRRIKGCVDAPAGSTLSASVRAEDQPGAPWERWLDQQPISALGEDGSFELCLPNPAPGRAGLLRVRVEIEGPDGQRSAAYSPDTLLAVATAARCEESEDVCCVASAQSAAPDAADAGAQSSTYAEPPAEAAPRGSEPPKPAHAGSKHGGGNGCVVHPGATSSLSSATLALLCVIGALSQRRRISGQGPR